MKQYLTLLKLEFLNNSKRTKKGSRALSLLSKVALGLVVFALFEVIIMFAFDKVLNICVQAKLQGEFLIFFLLIVQVVQLLFGIGITTKTLFFSPDEDKLKLPVSGTAIIMSKITYLFIKEIVFTFVLMFPVMIMYGVKVGASASFYAMIPLDVLLVAAVPFFLSLLFSIPTMYLMSFLRNKFFVMLILYVLFVAAGFYVYITLLKTILTMLQSSDILSLLSASVVAKIQNVSSYFYVQVLIRNFSTFHHFFASFFVYLSMCVVLAMMVGVFAKYLYYNILISNLECPASAFSKKTQTKHRSITAALFHREFLNIFRSMNYSFQYLTVAITTPLMVYFSSSVSTSIGLGDFIQKILPGVTVLILIMFLSVGSSFAASSVTREGDKFFHTKIIPVSFTKQIFVKFMLYTGVIVPSILVSCLVLWLGGFLTVGQSMIIFAGVSLVMIGNIAKSINIDIKRPKFAYVGAREMTSMNSNVSTSLGLGFVVATILGVAGIVVSIFVSVSATTLVLFGFAVPFSIFEVVMLFCGLEKKYRRIEV